MYALNVGLQGVQPLGAETGLADPLRTVMAISNLIAAGTEQGLSFHISTDFAGLARERRRLRKLSNQGVRYRQRERLRLSNVSLPREDRVQHLLHPVYGMRPSMPS